MRIFASKTFQVKVLASRWGGALAIALAAFVGVFVGVDARGAALSATLEINRADPDLPAKAATTDVLKQGFVAQLKFGNGAQLPAGVRPIYASKWVVTEVTLDSKRQDIQGVFEEVAGIPEHARQTLTQLRFNKPGHWTVKVYTTANYEINGQLQGGKVLEAWKTVEIDIVAYPVKITINNTEDKLGVPKETDDFVPVAVPGMPRPYTTAEIKLGKEGFPPGFKEPQEVQVAVSPGGVLRDDDANADLQGGVTLQLVPGGPAKKFKLFGARPSPGWDGDFIEAKLVNPPAALQNASPAREDFTAFKLERATIVGTKKEFDPKETGVANADNRENYEAGSDRVPFHEQKATIRLVAVLAPEVPVAGKPAGGIAYETVKKLLDNKVVWTLPKAGVYTAVDYQGNDPKMQPIGLKRSVDQAIGLDWPREQNGQYKAAGGPFIQVSKWEKKGKQSIPHMPLDNDGFGPLKAPVCELRWPTALGGNNVKVAEVDGLAPRLFFQRLRNDHPGNIFNVMGKKERVANWFYYWAKEQKGPCSYSVKKDDKAYVEYSQPVPDVEHPNAFGIYFPQGLKGTKDKYAQYAGRMFISDVNIKAPMEAWNFPSHPGPKTAGWVTASWKDMRGPNFVNLTVAHESTHKKLDVPGDPKADADGDGVNNAWEEQVAGMKVDSGESFPAQFGISHGSGAKPDQEFYCALGSAIGMGEAANPDGKKITYHGITPSRIDPEKPSTDWSVNGANWNK